MKVKRLMKGEEVKENGLIARETSIATISFFGKVMQYIKIFRKSFSKMSKLNIISKMS